MTNSTLNGTTFTVIKTSGGSAALGNVSVTGNTVRFTPSIALSASTAYTAKVTTGAKDLAGNALAADFTWSFTTAAAPDTTPPTVQSTSPTSGATGVAQNASVSATFSEAMTNSTLNTASFTLKRTSGGGNLSGTVSVTGNTARFTPSAALAGSTQYTATISTAAKDASANALASAYTWTFTTAAIPDTTPPTVSSRSPANAATSVALTTIVSATFSEPMTNSTLNTTSFTLETTSGGTPVSGSVVVSGNTATFTPSANLAPSTQYTATVTTAAKDAAGNAMASDATWSFTTVAPDTTPPTVTGTSPSNGASGVALNTNVSATFSETMTNSTINAASFTLETTSGGVPVTGTVGISGATATFDPSVALLPNTQYTATITTAVADAAGNSMAANRTWSFTTGTPGSTLACPVAGPPALSVTATRTSGVAPLAVFFNATATTSTTVTSRPFHEIEYRWDFGDAGSGTWVMGSRAGSSSRNAATGPVAGHVFETSGTYTVVMTALDGTNTSSCSVQITVANPDTVFAGTNTVCFSTSGSFANCPIGATNVTTSDFDSAVNSFKGTNRRLLFRRGETFTASTSSTITSTGPGLIGAFGSGAKPIVNASGGIGSDGIIGFGDQSLPNSSANLKDWRVMDLSFNGGGSSEVIAHNGGFNQLTYLRLDATNCGDACIMFNGDILAFLNQDGSASHHTHQVWTEVAIADCTLADPSGWSLYLWAKNFSLLGNSFDNQGGGSHTVRIIAGINGAISNNLFARNGTSSPAGNHTLKFHAPTFTGTGLFPAGTYSENVVISDNKFMPNSASVNNWTVSIDPQDSSENERLRNIIFERNWLTAGANTSIGVSVQATDMTIRNNFYNGTGAAAATFVDVDKRSSGAAAPNNIFIYNNTMFTSSNNLNTSDEPFINIQSSVTSGGATIMNNLGYAPAVSSGALLSSGTTTTASNNSSNAQVKTAPSFVSGSPSSPSDVAIQSGSYARNGGASVPVFSDFFGAVRPQGTIDMGFVEIP